MRRTIVILAMLATIGCMRAGPPLPDDQSIAFCLAREDWPKLISIMDSFGRAHDLKRIGETEQFPNEKPMLNVALAGNYSYFFGDDLDLWVTSDPFRENVISYSVLHRDKRPTPEQWALGKALLKEFRPLTWQVSGTKENPSCEKTQITQTPQ